MNNAVSADVTLFSRVHPDIVKRISVSSVIVSALLAIGGIGAFVTAQFENLGELVKNTIFVA